MNTFEELATDVASKSTPDDAVKAMLAGIATMFADARATGNPAAVENLQIQLVQNSPALVAAVAAKPETAKAAPVAHVPAPVEPAAPATPAAPDPVALGAISAFAPSHDDR